MHEYLVLNEENDGIYIIYICIEHALYKRKIVLYIFDIKRIYQGFLDNDIYFAQLVCLELMEELNFTDSKIEKLWANFFHSHLNDLWPSSVMQY